MAGAGGTIFARCARWEAAAYSAIVKSQKLILASGKMEFLIELGKSSLFRSS